MAIKEQLKFKNRRAAGRKPGVSKGKGKHVSFVQTFVEKHWFTVHYDKLSTKIKLCKNIKVLHE